VCVWGCVCFNLFIYCIAFLLICCRVAHFTLVDWFSGVVTLQGRRYAFSQIQIQRVLTDTDRVADTSMLQSDADISK